jgi:hypothetical protein
LFLAEGIECHQGRSKSRDNACGKNHAQIHLFLPKRPLMALVKAANPDVTTLRNTSKIRLGPTNARAPRIELARSTT